MKLGDLITFKSGEVITRLQQRSPLLAGSGDYRLYDMAIFASESGEAERKDTPRYLNMAEGLTPMPKDVVILAALGARMTISSGVDENGLPMILDSNFSWIQTDSSVLDPAYLVYWFNESAEAQRLVHASASQAIAKVTLKSISDFNITLPPIKKQRVIGQMYQLMRKRRTLVRKREQLFTTLTLASLADADIKE